MEIKLFAKPHIAHFFLSKYGNPLPMAQQTPVGKLIKTGLTSEFSERVTLVPDHMQAFYAKPSTDLKKYFMHQQKCQNIADLLELQFWNEAAILCLQSILDTGNIQKGIDYFYEQFGFTDDLYSKDNFRRQLQRKGVLHGSKKFDNQPLEGPRRKYAITPVAANKIRKLYSQGNLTQKALATQFGISQGTVSRIVK